MGSQTKKYPKQQFKSKISGYQKEKTEPKPVAPGTSSAISSSIKHRFDLIPRAFLERVADRFALGALKYPAFNYKQGFDDKYYIIDRLNHLQQHVQELLSPQTEDEWEDDQIGAIGFAAAFLAEVMTTEKGRQALNEIRSERSARCQLQS